ncbi:hypothetical protein [Streptomyces sp. NPDC051098]|uniref:hypothetical protein n=1 Tax=Streptomyces sp. NPDC051098 TaxID=3155411 RepID=UPI00342F43DA
MGDEFEDAMNQLWGVTSEITGLGRLEACLDKADFEHCSGLAADALIGAKTKALEKAFNALKLLKRGCKVVSRSALSPASFASFAASSDLPCGVHSVPGLPRDKSMITNGPGDCQACAERIRNSLGEGEVVRIPAPRSFFDKYRDQETDNWNNGYHAVVVLNEPLSSCPAGGNDLVGGGVTGQGPSSLAW